jgi:hypothetical protein
MEGAGSMNNRKYREMCKPHADMDTANKALNAFMEAVQEARERFLIPNVVVSVATFYEANGDELEAATFGQWGDQLRHESMIAWTLGQIQRDRQNMIAGLQKAAMRAGGVRG